MRDILEGSLILHPQYHDDLVGFVADSKTETFIYRLTDHPRYKMSGSKKCLIPEAYFPSSPKLTANLYSTIVYCAQKFIDFFLHFLATSMASEQNYDFCEGNLKVWSLCYIEHSLKLINLGQTKLRSDGGQNFGYRKKAFDFSLYWPWAILHKDMPWTIFTILCLIFLGRLHENILWMQATGNKSTPYILVHTEGKISTFQYTRQ